MRAGIDAEDAKRSASLDLKKNDEETQKRLERNRTDYELQQQLTQQLSSPSSEKLNKK